MGFLMSGMSYILPQAGDSDTDLTIESEAEETWLSPQCNTFSLHAQPACHSQATNYIATNPFNQNE